MKNRILQTTFGHKIKALRTAKGLSEPEVAILLQQPYFSYIELEHNISIPTKGIITQLASIYNISYQELQQFIKR